MELSEIIQEMRHTKTRLDGAIKELHKQAKNKAKTERDYKIALRMEILNLKTQGYPATLILELAKGNETIADLRLNRDIAKGLYDSARESMQSLRVEASMLQTIAKFQDEL
ncbi:hypothetical protein BKM15_25860 [Pseudomonas syringae pv. syringae]|nr:hypothetical protein BKM15_25860 [Pseudomonas syringae pv. syringae]